MTPEEREHEEMRRRLWFHVAVNVARSDMSKEKATPGAWANKALSDYDQAFPNPIPPVKKT